METALKVAFVAGPGSGEVLGHQHVVVRGEVTGVSDTDVLKEASIPPKNVVTAGAIGLVSDRIIAVECLTVGIAGALVEMAKEVL